MKILLLSVVLLSSMTFVLAKDPFDKNQRAENTEMTSLKTNVSCHLYASIQGVDTPFKQMTLVGIIDSNTTRQAIFIDKNQQIIITKINDVISQEKLTIKSISLQQVKLSDCQQSQFIYARF